MKRWLVIPILALAMAFGLNGMAHAIPCGFGGVSDSNGCENGPLGANDKINPTLTVNDESFFGHSDWVFLQKGDIGDTDIEYKMAVDIGLSVTVDPGGGDTGTWSFDSSAWGMYEDIMIVLKTGGGKDEVNFSGYLLDNESQPTSGTWDTGGKDLSHLTVYGRGVSVPEPATLILLGFGLTGLGILSRRKSRSS